MAELLSKGESRDRQGNLREVEFYLKDRHVIQRIKKNGGVTHDIKYRPGIWSEVAEAVVSTQGKMVEKGEQERIPFNPEELEMSLNDKVDLIDQLLSSLDARELEELKHSDDVFTDKQALHALTGSGTDKDVEKIKEDVLQLIYEEYGFDWFTMPEFRKVYDINYDRSEAYRYLQQMEGRWLRKKTIPEEDRTGNTKYRYKLGKTAEQVIKDYGAFDTEDYPVYRKKCREYKQG